MDQNNNPNGKDTNGWKFEQWGRYIVENIRELKNFREQDKKESSDEINDLKQYFTDEFQKLAKVIQCDVHAEKMKGMNTRINWLYTAFSAVVLCGIVLGLWVKAVAG
jgi:hypothetical protein